MFVERISSLRIDVSVDPGKSLRVLLDNVHLVISARFVVFLILLFKQLVRETDAQTLVDMQIAS